MGVSASEAGGGACSRFSISPYGLAGRGAFWFGLKLFGSVFGRASVCCPELFPLAFGQDGPGVAFLSLSLRFPID